MVQGHYCQNCGQENVVPHETFWHMVKHFLYDITHFDSKFFDSMRYLLFKPGFLPGEYVKGKRASYLNPIKKYVFTSAIFFLLFFSFFGGNKLININFGKPLTTAERQKRIEMGEQELLKNPGNQKWDSLLIILKDTSKVITSQYLSNYWDDFEFISIGGRKYKSLREYDSVQGTLIKRERDNFLNRLLNRKNLQIKEKYKDQPDRGFGIAVKIFMSSLPYLLFVSLPLFALILKLLYVRRKQYYYADHGIFSIYHYIFTFLLLLIVFSFDKLNNITGWEVFDILTGLLFMSGGVYLLLSMKKFYGQGWGKTILKFILLNMAATFTLFLLFVAFLLFSVFQI
jgi:hypothetical protein